MSNVVQQIKAIRQSILKNIGKKEALEDIQKDYEKLVKILISDAVPEEKRNYAVILNYMGIIATIHVGMGNDPQKDSEVTQEFDFHTEEWRELFSSIFEKAGYLSDLIRYQEQRVAYLRGVYEQRRKEFEQAQMKAAEEPENESLKEAVEMAAKRSVEAEDEQKKWAEKLHASRDSLVQRRRKVEEEVVVDCCKWENEELKKRGGKESLSKEALYAFKEILQRYREERTKLALKKEFYIAFPLQHCMEVEDFAVETEDPIALAIEWTKLCRGEGVEKKVGETTNPFRPLVFATVDPGVCNHCGVLCKGDKKTVFKCKGPCKGKYQGKYCSKDCLEFDKFTHAIYCNPANEHQTIAQKIAMKGVHSQDANGNGYDTLCLLLYYKVVAWVMSQNRGPADFVILRDVIKKGLEPFPKGELGEFLPELKDVYTSLVLAAKLNSSDPRHEFYIHAGLIMGIRKLAIPVFSDRVLSPISPDPARMSGHLMESKATGVALFRELIGVEPSCVPNVGLESGVDENGNLITRFRIIRPMKEGDPFRFCFADRGQMDVRVRERMNEFRKIYCECDLCKAQRALDGETQLSTTVDALVEKWKAVTLNCSTNQNGCGV